jgi:hypothetical protein
VRSPKGGRIFLVGGKKLGYSIHMADLEIVQSSYHHNAGAAPFYAAIVDDPRTGDTKLVICFYEQGYTAALSLDALISDGDVSAQVHISNGNKFDEVLRDALWYPVEDDQ